MENSTRTNLPEYPQVTVGDISDDFKKVLANDVDIKYCKFQYQFILGQVLNLQDKIEAKLKRKEDIIEDTKIFTTMKQEMLRLDERRTILFLNLLKPTVIWEEKSKHWRRLLENSNGTKKN